MKSVLVIEDSADVQCLVVMLLEGDGWSVRSAQTGQEGLTSLANQSLPDLVLLDAGLPDMEGYEVLEKVRADARTRALPVVVFSAARDLDERYARWGVRGHIPKPFDPLTLGEQLDALLQRS